jgi:hypothetical protein
MTTMYRRIPSDADTPLRALGLVFEPPRAAMDFLDVAVQVHMILSRGQGLAKVCAAAMEDETLEEHELQHALEVLHAYLEAAGLALMEWREANLKELQAQKEEPDA